MDDLVSILIPTYNRLEFTIEAIDSVLRQTYREIEIIVNDNHSTDDTFLKLKELYKNQENIKIYQNDNNIGPVLNWIECLKKARGAYVKILWSDDLLDEHFVEECVKALEENPNASFVYSNGEMFKEYRLCPEGSIREGIVGNNRESIFDLGRYFVGDRKYFLDLTYGCKKKQVFVSPVSALFRMETVKITTDIKNNIGYNHLENGAGTDLLIYLNALEKMEQFVYLPQILFYYREHEGSITKQNAKYISCGYISAKIFYNQHIIKSKKYERYCDYNIAKDIYRFHLKTTLKEEIEKYYGVKADNIDVFLRKFWILVIVVKKIFLRIIPMVGG